MESRSLKNKKSTINGGFCPVIKLDVIPHNKG